jgi:hypothetical protein
VHNEDWACGVEGDVLGSGTNEELFQSTLIMLGHHNDSCLNLISTLADDSSDGVIICAAVDDFHTVCDLAKGREWG